MDNFDRITDILTVAAFIVTIFIVCLTVHILKGGVI